MSEYGYGNPQPGEVWLDSSDRSAAMWAHLGALIASMAFSPVLGFVVPLVIMQGQGKRSPFVREHARESLNFQLTATIVSIAAGLLGLVLLVFVLAQATLWPLLLLVPLGLAYLAAAVVALIWMIKATSDANAGRPYRYPVSIRMVR
jgi:uncharacterized Tic20 family protein